MKPGEPEAASALSLGTEAIPAPAYTVEGIREDVWNGCVKAFVEPMREPTRELLIRALSAYWLECDTVERWIEFSAPRPAYIGSSHVILVGHLARGRSAAWLRVYYHGDDWIFAKRVKIAADDFRWTSPPLTFGRDNYADVVWESANIPYTRSLLPIVRRLVDAHESIVRFDGQSHFDLAVTAEMKHNIVLMMDALSAIGIP